MGGSKKALKFDTEKNEYEKALEDCRPASQVAAAGVENTAVPSDENSTMQGVVGEIVPSLEKNKGSSGYGRGFKRILPTMEGSKKGEEGVSLEKKRTREDEEDMDVDELDWVSKLGKIAAEFPIDNVKKAGPANRSCGNQ